MAVKESTDSWRWLINDGGGHQRNGDGCVDRRRDDCSGCGRSDEGGGRG